MHIIWSAWRSSHRPLIFSNYLTNLRLLSYEDIQVSYIRFLYMPDIMHFGSEMLLFTT